MEVKGYNENSRRRFEGLGCDRKGADDLLYRQAHQGALRHVRFARRQLRQDARLSGPAGQSGSVSRRSRYSREPGLNPHIEDVARRAAVAGFLALAACRTGV